MRNSRENEVVLWQMGCKGGYLYAWLPEKCRGIWTTPSKWYTHFITYTIRSTVQAIIQVWSTYLTQANLSSSCYMQTSGELSWSLKFKLSFYGARAQVDPIIMELSLSFTKLDWDRLISTPCAHTHTHTHTYIYEFNLRTRFFFKSQ